MAKVSNPTTISGHYGISPAQLDKLGVLDATLCIDTKLFIDPLLLAESKHKVIRENALAQYEDHFTKIIRLLSKCKAQDDPAWKAAYALLNYPEPPGLCLGYGAAGIHGSGWGEMLRTKVLQVARQVIAIGIDDPDLFPSLALIEDDIGPDRLSDMTANIIMESLSLFNESVIKKLKLTGESFDFHGKKLTFLRHPFETKPTPLVLLPTDILEDLPVALDWDGVAQAAKQNEEHRKRANEHIGTLWETKAKRDKARLKEQAFQSEEAFRTFLDSVRLATGHTYDTDRDPLNLYRWAAIGKQYADANPIHKKTRPAKSAAGLLGSVLEIIKQFSHLIEHCGLNKELYAAKDKPRHESSAQRLFFAAAYYYCKANDIDISPEIDTGNGRIDFKFSKGFSQRVLVEIKLSTNPNVVPGYVKQLEDYKASQETSGAVYLVINVGRLGKKDRDLIAAKNRMAAPAKLTSEIVFVDGIIKPSPSKK